MKSRTNQGHCLHHSGHYQEIPIPHCKTSKHYVVITSFYLFTLKAMNLVTHTYHATINVPTGHEYH